jgi:mono/diheme cytochrome c family protein
MSEFIGHFHVAIVHLPIGILMLGCVFQWMEKKPKFSSLHVATGIAFMIGMISAVLAAITGYLLSLNGDYDELLVSKHQWFGISVAVVSILMYYLYKRSTPAKLQLTASGTLFILIIITGHLGGSITHGSDYLTKSLSNSSDSSNVERKPIPNIQEAIAYRDIIQPLLQTKCYTCHGKNKRKGGLRMDDSLRLMKGGKDGVVIIAGNAEKSEMGRRTSLPREDDDHMPPKEKPQLNQEQIALIHWWIATGASFDKKVKELDQPENIKPVLLALQKIEEKKMIILEIPSAPVAKADEAALKKLRDLGVIAIPVAQNSNYLSVNFVTTTNFSDSGIHLLLPLKEQVIWLKLGNTFITDSALQIISQLKNLVRLQLEHTKITDKGLANLKSLQNLRYLNLVGTKITAEGLMQLKDLKNLQSIYLYQTSVKKSDWNELKKTFPKTLIDSGGYIVPFFATDTIEVKLPKTSK